MNSKRAKWFGAGAFALALATGSFVVVGTRASAQGAEQVPPGMIATGGTWCGTVSAPYGRFLRELTPLIDAGAEVQGFVIQNDGDYSALVCKRGRRD